MAVLRGGFRVHSHGQGTLLPSTRSIGSIDARRGLLSGGWPSASAAGGGSASDEGQRRREAAQRKHGLPVTRAQTVGGCAVSCYDQGVRLPKLALDAFADRVDEGCGRPLDLRGTMMGILSQHGFPAQRARSGPAPAQGCVLLDLLDQGEDPLPVLLQRQAAPAGERSGSKTSVSFVASVSRS